MILFLTQSHPVNPYLFMLSEHLIIRSMRRFELDILISRASREGWNPGQHDADIFWNTDPDGFIAAELDGELIGSGSIVADQRQFGCARMYFGHKPALPDETIFGVTTFEPG